MQAVVALPDDHRLLVNSSAALRAAIEALPPTAPVLLGLSALNRSRDALPPLIDAALASIAYYDETGDDSDMSSIGRAAAELQLLLDQVELGLGLGLGLVLGLGAAPAARPGGVRVRARVRVRVRVRVRSCSCCSTRWRTRPTTPRCAPPSRTSRRAPLHRRPSP